MKKTILILALALVGSCGFAATNDAVVVVAQPIPTLSESITNLILAISTLAGAITGIVGWLRSVRKGKALSTIINAVETFKQDEAPQINADLKAHVDNVSKEDGTRMLVRQEVAKEIPKEQTKP